MDVAGGKAAAWLPLMGAALGAAGAAIYIVTERAFPSSVAAFACVLFWAAAGPVLREGKLAMTAVALSILARWFALDNFAGPGAFAVFIAAQAVPRAAMIGLAWVSRPSGTGVGYALSSTLTTPAAIAALAQGILAAFLCGPRAATALIVGAFLIVRLARQFAYKYQGGVDGNFLGATEQILEVFILAVFACRVCAW